MTVSYLREWTDNPFGLSPFDCTHLAATVYYIISKRVCGGNVKSKYTSIIANNNETSNIGKVRWEKL